MVRTSSYELEVIFIMAFQGDSIYWVEVEKVVPNPFQPRLEFDEKKLEELAESIRMYGVLQPLTVTRSEVQREDGTFYTEYEIIAGERRLRASKMAGVAQVPVIIREGEQSEQEKLELAIIENLQREDLNAVDRALAFRQLAEAFGLSHVQVAKKMGRSREYVSNSIRLLNLPSHMLDSLKRGDMMEGHARTLLMLNDRPEEQEVVYKEILLKKLSVREVERIVRKIASDKIRKKTPGEFDSKLIELEKKFTETLGTRVQIQKTDFGGKLTIDYFSEEDLAVILKKVSDETQTTNEITKEDAERISSHTALVLDAPPVEEEQQAVSSEEMPEMTSFADKPALEFQSKVVTQNEDGGNEVGSVLPSNFANEQVDNYSENEPQEISSVSEFYKETDSVPREEMSLLTQNPEKENQVKNHQIESPEQFSSSHSQELQSHSVDKFSAQSVADVTEPSYTRLSLSHTPIESESVSEAVSSESMQHETISEVEENISEKEADESDLYSIRNFQV